MKEKLIKITQLVFTYGMSILLLAGFAVAIIYVVALIVGQPISVAIHEVMSNKILPYIYYTGILLSFDGMINIYLQGKKLFCLDISKNKEKSIENRK